MSEIQLQRLAELKKVLIEQYENSKRERDYVLANYVLSIIQQISYIEDLPKLDNINH